MNDIFNQSVTNKIRSNINAGLESKLRPIKFDFRIKSALYSNLAKSILIATALASCKPAANTEIQSANMFDRDANGNPVAVNGIGFYEFEILKRKVNNRSVFRVTGEHFSDESEKNELESETMGGKTLASIDFTQVPMDEKFGFFTYFDLKKSETLKILAAKGRNLSQTAKNTAPEYQIDFILINDKAPVFKNDWPSIHKTHRAYKAIVAGKGMGAKKQTTSKPEIGKYYE